MHFYHVCISTIIDPSINPSIIHRLQDWLNTFKTEHSPSSDGHEMRMVLHSQCYTQSVILLLYALLNTDLLITIKQTHSHLCRTDRGKKYFSGHRYTLRLVLLVWDTELCDRIIDWASNDGRLVGVGNVPVADPLIRSRREEAGVGAPWKGSHTQHG